MSTQEDKVAELMKLADAFAFEMGRDNRDRLEVALREALAAVPAGEPEARLPRVLMNILIDEFTNGTYEKDMRAWISDAASLMGQILSTNPPQAQEVAASDARDAGRFRFLQDLPAKDAQAFFWNHTSRKQRAAAIDAALASQAGKE